MFQHLFWLYDVNWVCQRLKCICTRNIRPTQCLVNWLPSVFLWLQFYLGLLETLMNMKLFMDWIIFTNEEAVTYCIEKRLIRSTILVLLCWKNRSQIRDYTKAKIGNISCHLHVWWMDLHAKWCKWQTCNVCWSLRSTINKEL